MIGELFAIGTALCWGTSPILYRRALVGIDPVIANLVRTIPATILLAIIFFGSGGFAELLSVDLRTLLLIAASVVAGQLFGDLLLFESIMEMGASRSSAIFSIHPIFSMMFAFLLLNEMPTWNVLFGAFAIVMGLWLISLSMADVTRANLGRSRISMLKALVGASLWGASTFVLKIVVQTVTPLETITLRMLLLSVILSTVVAGRGIVQLKPLSRRVVCMLAVAGVIALVLGNFLLYSSLKLIMLSVVAPLASVSPLFSTLFAVVFLKEKISMGQLLGVASIFFGILVLTIF